MKKRLVAIGDSITHGSCAEYKPFLMVKKTFVDIVGEKFGFDEIINYGTNGTTISTDTDWRPTMAMCVYIDEMLPADMAIIAGGTNDHNKSVEIGDIDDIDDKTFYGGLNKLYEKAKKRYKKIVVITPISKKNSGANQKGYTIDDYRISIEKCCQKHGLICIDGKELKINLEDDIDRKKYANDGLHINQRGHELFAKMIIEKLKDKIV